MARAALDFRVQNFISTSIYLFCFRSFLIYFAARIKFPYKFLFYIYFILHCLHRCRHRADIERGSKKATTAVM